MTSFDSCISTLEAEGRPEEAWLRFEPVFSEADSEFQIRGNRDGLLLFAAAVIKAGRTTNGRVKTGDLFTDVSPDDLYLLYVTHGEEEHSPPRSSDHRSPSFPESLWIPLAAFIAACTVIGLWQVITWVVL